MKWDLCTWQGTNEKRNMYIKKETYTYMKRDEYMKRDICTSKKTCECKPQRPAKELAYEKKPTHIWKKNCVHEERPVYMKRDLCTWKETCEGMPKRPATELKIISVLNVLILWKKTYEKKPLHIWKETCVHAKRPVYMKRDLWRHAQSTAKELEIVSVLNVFMLWKETCEKKPIHLYIYEKRPAHVKRDL